MRRKIDEYDIMCEVIGLLCKKGQPVPSELIAKSCKALIDCLTEAEESIDTLQSTVHELLEDMEFLRARLVRMENELAEMRMR